MATTTLVLHPVYLTLVTAEPNGAGTIVRYLARRVLADGSIETFDQLARGQRLSVAQSRLTGITNNALDRARDADTTLQDLVEFAEGSDAWIVAYGTAARESLRDAARSAGYPGLPCPSVIGLDDLAAIVLPTAGRTGVRDLAVLYGAPAESAAASDAASETGADAPVDSFADEPALLERVWSGLKTDLMRLPLPLLAELNWMLAKSDHPLRKLLKAAEGSAVNEQFSDTFHSGKIALEKLFQDFSKIIDTLRPDEEEDNSFRDEPPAELVKPEDVRHMMGPEGPLAQLKGYEERPEQETMSASVADAFNRGTHLMIEA